MNGTYTISEAAEKWISMVREAKASNEQKAQMIANIEAATPKAVGMIFGVAGIAIEANSKMSFADATNAIKKAMRS